jgi:23S rRNA (pseudouridine1915-N3)-methyltransferase
MQITFLAIGNTDLGFISDGIKIYTERLKHYVKFEIKIIQNIKNIKNLTIELQKIKESEYIETTLNSKSINILLDENGEQFTSEQFANWLQKKMNLGLDLTFVIGGSYGFDEKMKKKYTKIGLSKMTFSHQMIRLFFVEQLYRAFTIIKGENYHH